MQLRIIFFYVLTFVYCAITFAQTTITIFNGNANVGASSPLYQHKSRKVQSIYLKSEINTAGAYGPSTIEAIQLELTNTETRQESYDNFSVKIKNYTGSSFSSTSFIDMSDATTCFSGTWSDVGTTSGYKTISFSTEFEWDGTSNLLIEIQYYDTDLSDNTNEYGRVEGADDKTDRVLRTYSSSADVRSETTGTLSAWLANLKIDFSYTNTTDADFFTGATDSDWGTATNWLDGSVPTSSDNVVIIPNKTVTYIEEESVNTIQGECNNLTIEEGATLRIWSNGTTGGNRYLRVNGNLEVNGTITSFYDGCSGCSTDVFSKYYPMRLLGSSKTITIGDNADLTDASIGIPSGSYSLTTDLRIMSLYLDGGTLDMNGNDLICWRMYMDGGDLYQGEGMLVLSGSDTYINLENSGFYEETGLTYFISGTSPWTSGQFYHYDDGYVNYVTNQTVPSITYNNLRISTANGYTTTIGDNAISVTVNGDLTLWNMGVAGGTITTDENITLEGDFYLGNSGNAFTFNLDNRISRSGAGNGTFTMGNNDDLYINITYAHATNTAIALGESGSLTELTFYGTVKYNSNSDQMVMYKQYNELYFDGSGTKSLSSSIDVDADLTLNNGNLDATGDREVVSSDNINTDCDDWDLASTPYSRSSTITNNRIQWIFTKSELESMGFSSNTDISEISFYVCDYADATTYTDFTIKFGYTDAACYDVVADTFLTTATTTVYGPYSEVINSNGTHTHTFDSDFTWNGTDNLVMDICYTGYTGGGDSPDRQRVYIDDNSTTPNYLGAQRHAQTDICNYTTSVNSTYKRPVFTFTASGRDIYLAGDWINNSSNTIDFLYGKSTVYFDGTTTQYINQNGRDIDFYNVVCDGTDVRFYNAGDNSASEKVEITNDLTINETKTLKLYDPSSTSSNGNITLAGNLINNGEISGTNYLHNTADYSYFSMSGTDKIISGSGTYTDFLLQSDGSIDISSNNLSIHSSKITSGNDLELEESLSFTLSNDLIINGTFTADNSTDIVVGEDVTIGSTGVFTLSNTATDPTLSVGKNWENSGQFNYNESVLTFNTSENGIIDDNGAFNSGETDFGGYTNEMNRYGTATIFDCDHPFILKSVDIYADEAGDATFVWSLSDDTGQDTSTVSLSAGWNTVDLNFSIIKGTGHKIFLKTNPATQDLGRINDGSFSSYPIDIGEGGYYGEITGNSSASTKYGYLFNWEIEPSQEFGKVIIDKSGGFLTLSNHMYIESELTFTNGIIISNTNSLLKIVDGVLDASIGDGNSGSFVHGPVQKIGDDAFTFPIGDLYGTTKIWAPLEISNFSGEETDNDCWTVSYNWLPPDDSDNLETGIDHISEVEYWDIEKTIGHADLTCGVKLFWKDANRSVITNPNDLVIAHYWNDAGTVKWWKEETNEAIQDNGTDGYIFADFTHNGQATFGSTTSNNPLPVSLVSFDYHCKNNFLSLNWITLTEINNDYFILLSSKNGITWDIIDTIQGQGNTSELSAYEYNISNNYENKYYKLIQVDYSGVKNKLPIIFSDCSQKDDDNCFVIYPNPASEDIVVKINSTKNEQFICKIFNSNSEVVISKTLLNNQKNFINVKNLSPGVYLIQLSSPTEKVIEKLVIF